MSLNSLLDRIKEQEWYQQIQNSWGQLPPEQQRAIRIGGGALLPLLALYFLFSAYDAASTAKREYYDKEELSRLLTQANDEIRRLKGQNAGISQGGGPQTWAGIFEGMATLQGLPAGTTEILKESPGSTQNVIQETLLEVKWKGLQLRQMVQMLFAVEHGSPPIKLKGLIIEPSTTEGLLNAKLNVSGYMAKPEKGEKGK
jgi:type II secretory pathway component PulM